MSHSYETVKLFWYFGNLMRSTNWRSVLAGALFNWASEMEALKEILVQDEEDNVTPIPLFLRKRPRQVSEQNWRRMRLAVDDLSKAKPKLPLFERNLKGLADMFGLDDIEREILRLSISYHIDANLESLIDALYPSVFHPTARIQFFASMIAIPVGVVARRLKGTSALMRTGLLSVDFSGRYPFGNTTSFSDSLHRALLPPNRGIADLRRMLLGAPLAATLRWEDFDHLKEDRDILFAVLDQALLAKTAGVNILFYGPPGTGKTELCKTLACRLSSRLYSLGEQDEDGGEPSRNDRIAALKLAEHLLPPGERTLLLFDEMDDFVCGTSFGACESGTMSRVFMLRLLENNPLPIFWTSNHVQALDPALLRRMTLAIEIKVPSSKVRERVWQRLLKKEKLSLDSMSVHRLAREFEAPPALAANAVRAARLAGGGEEVVRHTVRGIAKAMRGGGEESPAYVLDSRYDGTLINADADLETLCARLEKGRDRRVSFCLSGPPGTGKSAWARSLAGRLGMGVLHKRASDLISKWLGESEQNIAAAFAEAAREGALLVFDEADSLLADRRRAERSWEISQVNEMLTWMEVHPLPFVCTTNLAGTLDPASARRFTFKVRFDYLKPEQIRTAFVRFFGLTAPARLDGLRSLTPADFSLVRRKAELIGCLEDAYALGAMLEDECRAKPEAPRPIGFAR